MSKPLIYQNARGDRYQVVGIFAHAVTGEMMYAIAPTTHLGYISVQTHAEFSSLVAQGLYKDVAKIKKMTKAQRIKMRSRAALLAEQKAPHKLV